jgi:folate-binding protein YgfZ
MLPDKWKSLGASLDEAGIPLSFGSLDAEVKVLRKDAGIADRSNRGRISVFGEDRVAFLQALFTNDVNRPSGEGVYGFFLTPKGRIVSDARIYVLSDRVLLDVEPAQREAVLGYLDRYHFTEKVEFEDVTGATVCLGLYGPRVPVLFEILSGGNPLPAESKAFEFRSGEATVVAIGNGVTGEPGAEFFLPKEAAEAFVDKLLALQAKPVGLQAIEVARTEAGVPRFGIEMNENTIPLEAGLGPVGISFTKGCYVGQEVIARIDARGEPAKRLAGFSVDGPLPAAGTPIRQGDREIGFVTSAIVSPSLRGRPIAMGYVHKNVADTAEDLYAGDTHLWIVPRPFYPPKH